MAVRDLSATIGWHTHWEGGVARIAHEHDAARDPGPEGAVDTQLPFTHRAFRDELKQARDSWAEVGIHLEHSALVRPRGPCCSRRRCKVHVGLRCRDIENRVARDRVRLFASIIGITEVPDVVATHNDLAPCPDPT